MKHTIARILVTGSVASGVLFAGTASAIDWNVTGFVRQEIGYNISSSPNPNNDAGNKFNNRIQPQLTVVVPDDRFAPTTLHDNGRGVIGGLFSGGFGQAGSNNYTQFSPNLPAGFNIAGNAAGLTNGIGFLPAAVNGGQAFDCHNSINRSAVQTAGGLGARVLGDGGKSFTNNNLLGTVNNCPLGQTHLQPGDAGYRSNDNNNINLFNSRLEIDVQAKISKEFSAYMKFRAYYDGTRHFSDGKTGNHFESKMWGDRGTIAEWNSPDAIIDIPALYVDWNRGPLWIRLGNQTIAWGEAYFFRTTDVANGLDLRRHLTLGPGAEEYQDQRIASPGIRVSYTFKNGYELDMFAQMFSPTILPAQNTPYNLVPTSGARVNDQDGFDDAQGAINYGARITMPLTDKLTGTLAVVNRRNPDGMFTSIDSPTQHAGFVNTGCLNNNNDTLNFLANGVGGAFFGGLHPGFGGGTLNGANAALASQGIDTFPVLNRNDITSRNGCGSPFAPDPHGTPSNQYWQAIQGGRIDNFNYLTHVIDDFPAAEWAVRDVFGFGQEQNFADTMRTVEGFRTSFGPFIQWVGRQFKRETIFMGGANYLIEMDDPNSFFDQMIVRGEIAVTPNKKIGNDLRFIPQEINDVVAAFIAEKYHRISDSFPATYFVFQWMHRTRTDLFGRDLNKNDTPDLSTFVNPVTGQFTEAAFSRDAMRPRGTANANYVVFAFQQPFPDLIWRFDFAILIDVAGGYLVQPGLRYRPAADWQWDLYANIIESPGGDNDTITETIDFADEIFLRLTYFF